MATYSRGNASSDDLDFLGGADEDFDRLIGSPAVSARAGGLSPAALDAPQGQVLQFVARAGLAVVAGWACIALGVVLLFVGYWQVSGTNDVAKQLAYLSAQTAAGMFLGVVGVVLILSHHYRGFAFQLRELRREQLRRTERPDA